MFSRISHHPRGREKEGTRKREEEGGAEKDKDVAFEKLFGVNSVYTNPRALWGCLHSDMFFLFSWNCTTPGRPSKIRKRKKRPECGLDAGVLGDALSP